MEIKIKENIDKGSIVLKHKIALETISILEEKDNTLATEVELYAMVATVDNFSEGSLLDLVTSILTLEYSIPVIVYSTSIMYSLVLLTE